MGLLLDFYKDNATVKFHVAEEDWRCVLTEFARTKQINSRWLMRSFTWRDLEVFSYEDVREKDIRAVQQGHWTWNNNTFYLACVKEFGGAKSVRHHFKGVEGFDG